MLMVTPSAIFARCRSVRTCRSTPDRRYSRRHRIRSDQEAITARPEDRESDQPPQSNFEVSHSRLIVSEYL